MYVNKLILTPFSPFDVKCKKLNAKNLWKCIFWASRRVSFSYFPKIALDHGRGTFKNFRGLCYNIQFKPYATSKVELFMTKNILNMTGLLDLTLKHINKFRLRQ